MYMEDALCYRILNDGGQAMRDLVELIFFG
jgi:hypothetical protein